MNQDNMINLKNDNVSKKSKIRVGLIVGIVAMIVAAVIVIIFLIEFVNSSNFNNNDLMNDGLEVSLERNNFICSDDEVCNDLNDSIVSIKNLIVNYDDDSTRAIILDKDGNVYLKMLGDVIKLKGKTKLKDIEYTFEVSSKPGDIIIYDDNDIYYVDSENYTIKEYFVSSDIEYIINFDDIGKFSAINKDGKGVIYYSCDNNTNILCQNGDEWYYEEVNLVNNANYAGGEVILMNNKLYAKTIFDNLELDTQLIMDNVNKVWAWDNLKSNVYLMMQTIESELYMVEVNRSLQYMKFKVNLDDKVNDVYFISAGSYGKVVVVGEKTVSLVLNSYNENYEKSVEIKTIDGINSYIEDIRGFYSEDDKLFVLLSDGNTYLVKDFLEDK